MTLIDYEFMGGPADGLVERHDASCPPGQLTRMGERYTVGADSYHVATVIIPDELDDRPAAAREDGE